MHGVVVGDENRIREQLDRVGTLRAVEAEERT